MPRILPKANPNSKVNLDDPRRPTTTVNWSPLSRIYADAATTKHTKHTKTKAEALFLATESFWKKSR